MANRYLNKEEVRAFYNRFGLKQDWQRFYEGHAMRDLLLHGQFENAQSVFELGCGTGFFARTLIEGYLPATASYVGVDISSTMVDIARRRLAAFEGRTDVLITDGSLSFNYADGSFDRFVSNYVMDLLPPDEIRQALEEAYRLLKPDGYLCLVSLTIGNTFISHVVTQAWSRIFTYSPYLVGGCRPIQLQKYLDGTLWLVDRHIVINAFGIPSEVVVASKILRKLNP